jgi:hypothetical protein
MPEPKKYIRNPNVSWRTIEGQAVLIFNKGGEIQVLNEVGTYIWEHAEEDFDETVRSIVAAYSIPPEEARKDAEEFVGAMVACGAFQPAEG